MTPEFAKPVDTVFLHVLRLQERIAQGEQPSPQDERAHIRGWMDQAEAKIGQSPEWKLAKYALVAWIDEMLLDSSWEGSDWWKNNVLEQELFNTRDRFHQFYERAKEAHSAGYRNALEVYYLCVVLGFRGLYADSWVAQQDADRFELPPTIEKWAAQVSMAIQLSPRPPIASGGPMGPGAPPLNGQALLISSSMLAAVLGALVVAVLMLSNS
ncbi:MAG TPA: DotU family type IV/VI secretion system protein [Pirellulales bacterium]|nr:DotU family type IV/VI secretion system protein [Pirellulales bacterium]